MPAYITSPFKPTPTLLIPGFPTYLWGSWNDKTGPTQGVVLQSLGIGATAELIVKILSGNIPVVGALITVVGVAASANFNVTNAVITAVDKYPHGNNPDNGMYALAYAATVATPMQADAGQFIIPQPEVAEALTAVSSAPVVMPYGNSTYNQNQGLTAVVSFPSLPTSVIVSLQQAVQDIDSEYATIAVAATVAGGVVTTGPQITVDPTLGRFFRFSNGAVVGGTLPTIIAKLLM
jgi:hypothetical protein